MLQCTFHRLFGDSKAELIGLIGSIWAIAGIAGAAAKLSQSLYRTARQAGSAGEDIEAIATKVAAFPSLITMAHDSIRNYCQKQPQLQVLQFINDHSVVDHWVVQSELIEIHIKNIRPYIRVIRSRIDLVTRFKWILRNPRSSHWDQDGELEI